jgi:hypothetical protein
LHLTGEWPCHSNTAMTQVPCPTLAWACLNFTDGRHVTEASIPPQVGPPPMQDGGGKTPSGPPKFSSRLPPAPTLHPSSFPPSPRKRQRPLPITQPPSRSASEAPPVWIEPASVFLLCVRGEERKESGGGGGGARGGGARNLESREFSPPPSRIGQRRWASAGERACGELRHAHASVGHGTP